jgi:chitin disaccharide deacetylase
VTGGSFLIIADDYGLGPAHDAVMRRLLAEGAVDGVSVLVETCAEDSARALSQTVRPDQRIGLHLNLTLAPPGTAPRPARSALLLRSAVGLGAADIRMALDAQWARFIALFGRKPDHIDGHEHCHAFPGIDRAVLGLARENGVAVRSMVPPALRLRPKDAVLAGLGHQIRRRARRARVETNAWFLGVLPLHDPGAAITRLTGDIEAGRAWAAESGETVWCMVHPGDRDDPVQIPGHPAELRSAEADLLRSLAAPPGPAPRRTAHRT